MNFSFIKSQDALHPQKRNSTIILRILSDISDMTKVNTIQGLHGSLKMGQHAVCGNYEAQELLIKKITGLISRDSVLYISNVIIFITIIVSIIISSSSRIDISSISNICTNSMQE